MLHASTFEAESLELTMKCTLERVKIEEKILVSKEMYQLDANNFTMILFS